jgi:hypothetical protein
VVCGLYTEESTNLVGTTNEARVEMTLVGLRAAGDQLRLAREFAVLGDYDTSRVYYQGVLSQVARYARAPMASSPPAVGTPPARGFTFTAAAPTAAGISPADPPSTPASSADTSTPWTETSTRPIRTARYVPTTVVSAELFEMPPAQAKTRFLHSDL